jgi:hypothetical protein
MSVRSLLFSGCHFLCRESLNHDLGLLLRRKDEQPKKKKVQNTVNKITSLKNLT